MGTTEMSWKIERLYHTIVNAKDLDETIAFYKILGFEVLHDRRHMAWPADAPFPSTRQSPGCSFRSA